MIPVSPIIVVASSLLVGLLVEAMRGEVLPIG
jgi:hypothetical protein